MGNFTKEEQTNVVKQAMELEQAIIDGGKRLGRLKAQSFKSAPDEPVRKVVDMNVQPVAPDYSALPSVNMTMTEYLENEIRTKPNLLNKLMTAHPFKRGLTITAVSVVATFILLPLSVRGGIFKVLMVPFAILGSAGIWLTLIYYFKKKSAYDKKIAEFRANLEAQPEYQRLKAEAERVAQEQTQAIIAERQRQQEEYDRQYIDEKQHFDTVVMPQYEKEKAEWETAREKEVQECYDKLKADEKTQADLYESSKVIPMQYRDIAALTYIYQLMSTSDYDIKEAINMYDKEIARQQEMMRLQEQQRANDLAEEQNYRLAEQNYHLEQQAEIAEQQLKHDRRADAAAFVQRHNTNKYLKNRK